MRLVHLLMSDLKFQFKYGFFFIYFVLSVVYLFVLYLLPQQWKNMVCTLIIFSDPSALGLFFMGAIVLLEKNQRIHHALAISPIRTEEYVASKIISLACVSVFVAFVLAIGSQSNQLFTICLATFLTSLIFSLMGLIIATKINSLNQFILVMIPVETICLVPAIISYFNVGPTFLQFYPISLCLRIMANQSVLYIPTFLILAFTLFILFKLASQAISKMWNNLGGNQL